MHWARKGPSPSPDCKSRLLGNGLGPGGGREEEKPRAFVLPRRPGCGPAREIGSGGRQDGSRGTGSGGAGGRARSRICVRLAAELSSHQPVRGTTGRASGERAYTISSPAPASSIFPGLAWSFLADVFE
ncbi:unnamed protein product [Rangifer tarandus platyrhynchus]|uniref:Uncharacterized protein n=2 Tax=Rangifer tarandus platyrhynchus TaxID=3082113 RepID=A0ABN8ZAT7_RANTA|nr:unnamed protein product [Rangifer tarandus platyrhynchus]CAI9705636.1 unnamed protein product [Rangifer tarandus platyrhynchus]